MTHEQHFTNERRDKQSLTRAVMTGGIVGLAIISVFVFTAETKQEWGTLWRIKPLVITPLVTALGGGAFYTTLSFFSANRWSKTLGMTIGVLAFTVALWLGVVLGLNGTLWD